MTSASWTDPEFRRLALKSRDAWWTVLVIDPLSLPVLSVLLRMPRISPIGITTVGAAVGLSSVVSFLTGHLILGAVLFEVRFFLDCLDGKLARLRGLASPRGAFLDLTMDVIFVSGAMAALGWHLKSGDPRVPLALSASCTFVCLVLFWLILYDIDHPPSPVNRASNSLGTESALNRWLRRHRLVQRPRTVEVETLLLFMAPLTGSTRLLYGSFVLALVYYVIAAARLFVRLLQRSAPPSDSLELGASTSPLAP